MTWLLWYNRELWLIVMVCEHQLVGIRIGIKHRVRKLTPSHTRCHNILPTVMMYPNVPSNPITHSNKPIMCCSAAIILMIYCSRTPTVIKNLGYDYAKAFCDTLRVDVGDQIRTMGEAESIIAKPGITCIFLRQAWKLQQQVWEHLKSQ